MKAAQGTKTGSLGLKDFMKMQGEMAKVAAPRSTADRSMGASLDALAAGNKEPGSISGAELTPGHPPRRGRRDNQAAGAEFSDVAKFVKENAQLLSPEAKKAFAVYQQYAAAAQAKGQTGIDASATSRAWAWRCSGSGAPIYGDKSAAQALNALAAGNKTPGSISGREMEQAIINGTKDLDNQAAGTEFADIAKFVKENEQLLSPQAKKTFAIYEKYAKAAQARGQTGLNASDIWRMQPRDEGSSTRPFFPVQNPASAAGHPGQRWRRQPAAGGRGRAERPRPAAEHLRSARLVDPRAARLPRGAGAAGAAGRRPGRRACSTPSPKAW